MPIWTNPLRLSAVAGLSVVAVGCTADPLNSDPLPAGDSGVEEVPATARWMADTFADRPDTALGRILIPGAFNSTSYACAMEHGISPDSPEAVLAIWGTDGPSTSEENRERVVGWAKTQNRSLGQQLQDGIRFQELNLTIKDGVLVTWHSVYGVAVDEVLEEIVAFALAQPDEVVVLNFGITAEIEDWPLLGEALTAPRTDGVSVCDLIYDGTEAVGLATLQDLRARGRNLVWAPTGDLRTFIEERGDCALSTGDVHRTWSLTVTTEGVAQALAESVDSRDPNAVLINDFVYSLGAAESTLDKVSAVAKYAGLQEASVALGFAGDFPQRLIADYDGQGNMNIFAGAFYEDTTLIEAVLARNAQR